VVELDAPYLLRALAAGTLVAVPLGLLGCFVLLRDLAFFAHAVGVATFPGLVVGVALPGLGPFAGALAAALAFSGFVSLEERDRAVSGGAVTGVVLAAALALGATLLVALDVGAVPVERLLFGSLLAVSGPDVVRCGIVAALTVAALGLGLPRLAAVTFDRDWAATAGVHDRAVAVGLVLLVAVTVVAALPAVGSLLAAALLVVPAATARLISERLGPMLAGATALAVVEMAGGVVLARVLDLPPGAVVAVLAGTLFAVAAAARAAAATVRALTPVA
jgi:ABC-type Mn2+/Zn2+ transport system permease subunit